MTETILIHRASKGHSGRIYELGYADCHIHSRVVTQQYVRPMGNGSPYISTNTCEYEVTTIDGIHYVLMQKQGSSYRYVTVKNEADVTKLKIRTTLGQQINSQIIGRTIEKIEQSIKNLHSQLIQSNKQAWLTILACEQTNRPMSIHETEVSLRLGISDENSEKEHENDET